MRARAREGEKERATGIGKGAGAKRQVAHTKQLTTQIEYQAPGEEGGSLGRGSAGKEKGADVKLHAQT